MTVRHLAVLSLLYCGVLQAAATVRIADTLYGATGQRFVGVISIQWPTFDAADGNRITGNTAQLTITDGTLGVDLVPWGGYTVTYRPKGQAPYQKTWFVPNLPGPLKLKDVEGTGASGPLRDYSFSFNAQTLSEGIVSLTSGSNVVNSTGTWWTSELTGRVLIVPGCNWGYRFTYVQPTIGSLSGNYDCPSTPGTVYYLADLVVVPGTTHRLGSADLIIECWDNGSPAARIWDLAFLVGPLVDPVTFDVTMAFSRNQAGRCKIRW